MITVHHLNNSRSQRVLWMLEELELPYDIKLYQRAPVTMLAPPSLRAIHPLGKSPVISDDGVTIAESGAIIEYLAERYGAGRLTPQAGSKESLRYRYWMHYAEGSLMPLMVMSLIFGRIAHPPMPWIMRPFARAIGSGVQARYLAPQIRTHMDFMESELSQSAWFAGSAMTAADIQMSFPIEAAAARAGLDQRWPHLTEFLDRIHARPAYQRALVRGGPYELMH